MHLVLDAQTGELIASESSGSTANAVASDLAYHTNRVMEVIETSWSEKTMTCNHCDATSINGVRCHERGCPNEHQRIVLIDDGTMDTVFQCLKCTETIRFTFDPTDEEYDYDSFKLWALREAEDDHECEELDDE